MSPMSRKLPLYRLPQDNNANTLWWPSTTDANHSGIDPESRRARRPAPPSDRSSASSARSELGRLRGSSSTRPPGPRALLDLQASDGERPIVLVKWSIRRGRRSDRVAERDPNSRHGAVVQCFERVLAEGFRHKTSNRGGVARRTLQLR